MTRPPAPLPRDPGAFQPRRPAHPPGHPLREALREQLRGRGATAVRVDFRAGADGRGFELQTYRLTPARAAGDDASLRLPADVAADLRTLAQAAIAGSLAPETVHRGKPGTLAWSLGDDRFVIHY